MESVLAAPMADRTTAGTALQGADSAVLLPGNAARTKPLMNLRVRALATEGDEDIAAAPGRMTA
jgi:hypothetical protein